MQQARTRAANGWRPRPESNRRARICSPLRDHSATRPFQRPTYRGGCRSASPMSRGAAAGAFEALTSTSIVRRLARQRDHLTSHRRRARRTSAMSIDRTISPSGSIQRPRNGRIQKTPPTSSAMPIAMRAMRDAGSAKVRPNTSTPRPRIRKNVRLFVRSEFIMRLPIDRCSRPDMGSECEEDRLVPTVSRAFGKVARFPVSGALANGTAFAIACPRSAGRTLPDSSVGRAFDC